MECEYFSKTGTLLKFFLTTPKFHKALLHINNLVLSIFSPPHSINYESFLSKHICKDLKFNHSFYKLHLILRNWLKFF